MCWLGRKSERLAVPDINTYKNSCIPFNFCHPAGHAAAVRRRRCGTAVQQGRPAVAWQGRQLVGCFSGLGSPMPYTSY